MLETILKLYVMAMATGVTSPVPHLFGPPGCGKSTVVQELADLVGVKMHTINVARLSPLEVEGVQMPVDMELEDRRLHQLIATYWSQLKDGDILLLDEFLRGFPEVYNGLLDIITSRQVAWFKLPKVFIIAASNSTVAYDKALEDRLLHLPVPDPRKKRRVKTEMAGRIVDQLGLLPEMRDSYEMQELMQSEVLPMFDILDQLGTKTNASPVTLKGTSIRKLIGQAELREIHSPGLKELIGMNNSKAAREGKWQYVFLTDGKDAQAFPNYEEKARALPQDRLTDIQKTNLDLNLQLIEMEQIRNEKEGSGDDDNSLGYDAEAIFG